MKLHSRMIQRSIFIQWHTLDVPPLSDLCRYSLFAEYARPLICLPSYRTVSNVENDNDMCDHQHCRLESLNEKRSGVVQMVKLAEKERDSLEVYIYINFAHRKS